MRHIEHFLRRDNRQILYCLFLWSAVFILYLTLSGPNPSVSLEQNPSVDIQSVPTTPHHNVTALPHHHRNVYSNEDRLRYYMGKWYDAEPNASDLAPFPPTNPDRPDKMFKVPFKAPFIQNAIQNQTALPLESYWKPALDLMKCTKSNTFQCRPDDEEKEEMFAWFGAGDRVFDEAHYAPYPLMSKVRRIADHTENGVILLRALNEERHWNLVQNANVRGDIEWNKKRDSALWRGSCTGYISMWRDGPMLRESFVMQYRRWNHRNGLDIDVSFSDRNDYHFRLEEASNFTKWTLRRTGKNVERTVREQLKYKYLVALEGNDVSSSLKWMMLSNSCVFMPTPTKETWLMEGLLRPFVHYVPLVFDEETRRWDLEQKLTFCMENERKCREIAQNGKRWMLRHRFTDKGNEREMQKRILDVYCQNMLKSLRKSRGQ